MLSVLRARDALSKFNDALPASIEQFDDVRISRIIELLDSFAKTYVEQVPFALALVAKRLKTPWQLIYIPAKAAASKNAADIAATAYAIAVSMVLDQLEDKWLALRIALKSNRVLVAKEILTEIYDIETALQSRIALLHQSEWGKRLQNLMNAVAALVDAEVSQFPDQIGHVLESCRPRSHQSLAGRLTNLAWKGRDAVSGGAAFCKKLIS
jgi:hypothetical protein